MTKQYKKQYKRSYRVYSAWNYQREIEDLNRMSERGWQLVRGGCFHSRFVRDPEVRYRYQLDYRLVEDMGRYIETFREQGWEYVNSTFNGWHYFRKLYDAALPETAYEIFTDRESLHEMNNRWARVALVVGVIIGILAVLFAVRMILKPDLPRLVQFLTLLVESAVLLRGWSIMHKPGPSRSRRGDSAFLTVFLAVILLGAVGSIVLTDLRPNISTEQQASAVEQPIEKNRWTEFQVQYPDRYYLDLAMEAEAPMTFEIIGEDGSSVYQVTDTGFHEENIPLRLSRGHYWFSMSCGTGFHLRCSID